MIDKDTQKLLIVIGVAIVILWLAKPKNNIMTSLSNSSGHKLTAPKTISSKVVEEQNNGYVGIQAMRNAIDNGESKNELDKLNRMLLTEYGVKVFVMTNEKLCARNREGKTIAKEQ